MTLLSTAPPTPIGAERPGAAQADLREVDGRTVVSFQLDGRREDSTGAAEAEVVERALVLAEQLGCPVVGVVRSVAVAAAEGVDALV
ncbi:MAG: hypothetical protein ACTHN0_05330, partial [Aquihabitans sp.]